MNKVLVVDDDKVLQDSVKTALEFHHFSVDVADNGKAAVEAVYKQKYDLVVMDVNMPEMNGIDALIEMKRHDSSLIVLIMTAFSDVGDAVRAVKEGAYNYLEKPITSENLVALIKRALKARSLIQTMAFSAPKLSLGGGTSDKFVGESDVMIKVFDIIGKLAQVKTPVLIRGESGTGKELVAKAIHYNGVRKDERFVTINCAAIPETLIESELFGHEKGAFTGAVERKIGKFQFADGGTIFLDEIGDVSAAMQVKLLRVIQEQSFTPVGSNRVVKVDVRIIAASHKSFENMIKDGTFREDLFYRLNVLPVYLPALRKRVSDIPHLVDYYVSYFNHLHNLDIKGVSEGALKALTSYDWPGNIRELRNVIEHAFIIESSDWIDVSSLPESVRKGEVSKNRITADEAGGLINFQDIEDSVLDKDKATTDSEGGQYKFTFTTQNGGAKELMDFQVAKDTFEKMFIIEALKLNNGKINQTALKSNIPKKTLLRKIDKYEIKPKDYHN